MTTSKWIYLNENLKSISKKKLVRKSETYTNFNEFIIIVIEIDDVKYNFNLQREFKRIKFKKLNFFKKI